MNLNEARKHLIFETVAGSHAYGTATEESDIDLRGIFVLPASQRITLHGLPEQVSDSDNDVTIYELRKFLSLASGCNPNIIELLWSSDDCVKTLQPAMHRILENRHLFITKKAFHTFSGYAHAQIKKAKGQNKWVNNPWSEEKPDRKDYCYFIKTSASDGRIFPCRPVPVKEAGVNLDYYHVAKLEHANNVYRLYYYGEDARGVFRNGQLICESIPKEDEYKQFAGLLIYNGTAYERDVTNWKQYWDWKRKRNEARYRDMEGGEVSYDCKNLHHAFRLMLSGENIFTNGEPIVRFSGESLEFLNAIRRGEYEYETLMEMIEGRLETLRKQADASDLPKKPNMNEIERLYRGIIPER